VVQVRAAWPLAGNGTNITASKSGSANLGPAAQRPLRSLRYRRPMST
jgi:hypothetical protein